MSAWVIVGPHLVHVVSHGTDTWIKYMWHCVFGEGGNDGVHYERFIFLEGGPLSELKSGDTLCIFGLNVFLFKPTFCLFPRSPPLHSNHEPIFLV